MLIASRTSHPCKSTLCLRPTLYRAVQDGIRPRLTRCSEDVITGLQNATFEDKRRALEDLQVQVFIKGEQARVTCWVPVPDGVFALQVRA
jgi:hypothetical protein